MDILVTKRLTLRPPLDVDAEAIAENLQNPEIARMLSGVPSSYCVDDARKWISRIASKKDAVCFSIHRQKLIGIVSIMTNSEGQPNLSYWLAQEAWGEGFATEAARAVLSYAFRKIGWDEIASGAYEDNPASYAVLEKLGFEPSCTVADSNPTRGCEVDCNRVVLTRARFERLFGPLEAELAA